MITVIILVLLFYVFSGVITGLFRLGFGLLKVLFSAGLFLLLPVLLVAGLLLGLLAHAWPLLLLFGLICLAGRRRGMMG